MMPINVYVHLCHKLLNTTVSDSDVAQHCSAPCLVSLMSLCDYCVVLPLRKFTTFLLLVMKIFGWSNFGATWTRTVAVSSGAGTQCRHLSVYVCGYMVKMISTILTQIPPPTPHNNDKTSPSLASEYCSI